MDSVIHPLNNWGLVVLFLGGSVYGGRARADFPMENCITEMCGFIFGRETASGNV